MNIFKWFKIAVIFGVVLATLNFDVKKDDFSTLNNPSQAHAAWYNSSWNYRQKFTIYNPGSLTTDYQFLFSEGLIGRWKMDENTASTVGDSSGYAHDGTITIPAGGISWTTSGKYSNALSFSGVNTSYVNVGDYDIYDIPDNNITISAWFKTSSTNQMRILSKGFDIFTWSKGYFLEINNGDLRFGSGSGAQSTSLYFNTTGTSFADDAWHHVAAVIDSNSDKGYIYVDGTAQSLSAVSGSCGSVSSTEIDISGCTAFSFDSTYNLRLGRNDNAASQAWNGTLDEIRLFNRPMPSNDVEYLYNNNVSPLLRNSIYSICEDNGDDLRFTTSDGSTVINYYLEKFDASDQNARIWLKIPSLAASGDTEIYVYYGNPSASSVSSWQNTFSYTDDFADESIGANWTLTSDKNGTISESGGNLDFSYSGTSTNWWSAPTGREVNIMKFNSVPTYDFWAQIYLENYTVNAYTHAGMAVYNTDTSAYLWGRIYNISNYYRLAQVGGSITVAYYSSTVLPSYLGIKKNSSGYSFWLSFDNVSWRQVGSTYSDITFNNIVLFGKSSNGNALDFSMDDFLIRKTLDSQPTVSITSYEEIETPSLEFTIEGTSADTTHNGVTTDVETLYNSIPYGKLELADPKFAAHKLTVKCTAIYGYTVTVKLDGYIQGIYPANKIDPFAATDVSWTTPQTWSTPDGTESNTDTGWVGANTSDTRVTGWGSGTSGKFGPLSSTAHDVMKATSKDSDGTTAYVSYAIEVSEKQPPDIYSGTITYDIVATY